ncbi:MAG: site-specific DNA-methyltransferase [Gammaproteobacteria bacterium]
MAVLEQKIQEEYGIYLGDCMEVMPDMPGKSIDLSIYSPPFNNLYTYSSSARDLSNSKDYDEFLVHYRFIVAEVKRITKPGRMTAVHCTDLVSGNSGNDELADFSGDIVRLHRELGWRYIARYCVWKEPLAVRNRTMMKSLAHMTVVEDSSFCSNAAADYLLLFRNQGQNKVPITHPNGFTSYAGERQIPVDLHQYRGFQGKQTKNLYSHWIWRRYASAFWDDIRVDRILPHREAKDDEDEKHVHPLQLDVIERIIQLWSNPGEVVMTPFMGVGSEVYGALTAGRKGIGVELKESYYRQAKKNIEIALSEHRQGSQEALFAM